MSVTRDECLIGDAEGCCYQSLPIESREFKSRDAIVSRDFESTCERHTPGPLNPHWYADTSNSENIMIQCQIRLVSLSAEMPNLEIAAERLPVTLGRSKHADLQVLDPMVSRLQCRLESEGDTIVVKDLQSKNGTLVNGA